jgi:5-methylcytosine-specific restriction endonuclease McrA
MERDLLAAWLAEGCSLEEIGRRVNRPPSTVAYWLRKHGLTAVNHATNAPKGAIDREALSALVAEDLPLAVMAARLGRGVTTLRYWLDRYGLRTPSQQARALRAAGQLPSTFERICPQHGVQSFVLEGRGYYCCPKCRSDRVQRRRRHIKALLVQEAGGKCQLCGYDRYVGALEFHHVDPAEKSFSLAEGGITRSLARAREETQKCVLLCSTCHAEVEGGVRTLGLKAA